MVPIIWIEGLIAIGKTEFARRMSKELNLYHLPEPVDTNPYLEPFYRDPKAHAFGMQMWLLHHRFASKQVAAYEAARRAHKGIILDRCIAGDRVFAKLHHQVGNISDLDYDCYNFADDIMSHTIRRPTLLIYLKGQPETAYRRMLKRNRPAEKNVPIEYLQQLYTQYELLMEEFDNGLVPWDKVRRHTLIWDKDVETDDEWTMISRSIADVVFRGQAR